MLFLGGQNYLIHTLRLFTRTSSPSPAPPQPQLPVCRQGPGHAKASSVQSIPTPTLHDKPLVSQHTLPRHHQENDGR